jgi:hypothetical protein
VGGAEETEESESDSESSWLFVIYPGEHGYAAEKNITFWPVRDIPGLTERLDGGRRAGVRPR